MRGKDPVGKAGAGVAQFQGGYGNAQKGDEDREGDAEFAAGLDQVVAPVGTANMFSTGSKGPSTAATVSDERSA